MPRSKPKPKEAVQTFQEGDLIEQHRHFDGDEFLPGPDADKAGTRWRVLKIGRYHVSLRLEEGRYAWGSTDEADKLPGYESRFRNCDAYKLKFPGAPPNQQLFDEFRPVQRAG